MSPRPKSNSAGPGVLRRYRDRLPITDATPMLYLGEGDTPLVRSRRISERAGCERLYFKLEMCNPTGSFKDRGMVVAVAKAVEADSRAVLCASTGNTSAAAAAYAANCGLEAFVLVPSGNVAQGKLAQAVAHGARILALDGNFDAALKIAREISDRHDVALVNSINQHRIEGQKTAAFEIADALGDAPDYLFLPVGNAGNITAYWRGFVEYFQSEQTSRRPQIMGWQAAGAAPLVLGHPVENPETVATAIRIGNPAGWQGAIAARDESGGAIDSVTDDEILEAYRLLAQEEGIFPEPVGAVGLAGLLKWARIAHPEVSKGLRDQTIVVVVTGHGLKDPDTALAIESKSLDVPADVAAVERAMGLG